jgi:hypothetical protein
MVPAEGFEPPTNGLQNRCSTPELSRLGPTGQAISERIEPANRNMMAAAMDPSEPSSARPVLWSRRQARPTMASLSRCCRAAAAAASAASFFDLPKPSPSLRSRFHTMALTGVSGLPAIDSYS